MHAGGEFRDAERERQLPGCHGQLQSNQRRDFPERPDDGHLHRAAAGVGREVGRSLKLSLPLAVLIALVNPIVYQGGDTPYHLSGVVSLWCGAGEPAAAARPSSNGFGCGYFATSRKC